MAMQTIHSKLANYKGVLLPAVTLTLKYSNVTSQVTWLFCTVSIGTKLINEMMTKLEFSQH